MVQPLFNFAPAFGSRNCGPSAECAVAAHRTRIAASDTMHARLIRVAALNFIGDLLLQTSTSDCRRRIGRLLRRQSTEGRFAGWLGTERRSTSAQSCAR